MDGPRDERDFKAELEIKTPAWLPGIRIATSYQRQWDKRGADYANRTAEFAGIDTAKLEQQLSEGGPIADLFLEGGRRVVENGDEVLRDAVTRLVAAALRDDALIHDASYLMKKLSTCEALHVRAICAIPRPRQLPPPPELPKPSESSYFKAKQVQEMDESYERSREEWDHEVLTFSVQGIAETCRASKSVVRAALGELTSSGFVEELSVPSYVESQYGADFYLLTELGADFRDLILTIDSTEKNPDTFPGNQVKDAR